MPTASQVIPAKFRRRFIALPRSFYIGAQASLFPAFRKSIESGKNLITALLRRPFSEQLLSWHRRNSVMRNSIVGKGPFLDVYERVPSPLS